MTDYNTFLNKSHALRLVDRRLSHVPAGSYPSNQASRTQMRGRINRLDAQRLDKKYWAVLAGVTTDALRAAPTRKKRKH